MSAAPHAAPASRPTGLPSWMAGLLVFALLGMALGGAVPASHGMSAHGASPATSLPGAALRPAEITRVLAPGGVAWVDVQVDNSSLAPVTDQLYAVDAVTASHGGVGYTEAGAALAGAGRWLQPARSRVVVAPHSRVTVHCRVTVPVDAAAGDHLGGVAVQPAGALVAGGPGVSVRLVVRQVHSIDVEVPGTAAFRPRIEAVLVSRPAGSTTPAVDVLLSNGGGRLGSVALTVTMAGGHYARTLHRAVGAVLPGGTVGAVLPWPDALPLGTYRLTASLGTRSAAPVVEAVAVTPAGAEVTGAWRPAGRSAAIGELDPGTVLGGMVVLVVGAWLLLCVRRGRRRVLTVGLLLAAAGTALVPGRAEAVTVPALVKQGSAVYASTILVGASISPSLPSASTAGDLLVAVVSSSGLLSIGGGSVSLPGGWSTAITETGSSAGVTIAYCANCASTTSATFSNTGISITNAIAGQLSEWSGVATASPKDATTGGTGSGTTYTSPSVSPADSDELGIGAYTQGLSGSGSGSIGTSGGWAMLTQDASISGSYRSGVGKSAYTESMTGANSAWVAAEATFRDTCATSGLTVKASPTLSFSGVTLTAYDQTSSASMTLTPDDQTGTADGWNITVNPSTFSDGAGHSLPSTALQLVSASSVAAAGACVLPTDTVATPVSVPTGSATKVFDASAATGRGPSTVTLGFQLNIAPNTYPATYSSTWTVTIASGP